MCSMYILVVFKITDLIKEPAMIHFIRILLHGFYCFNIKESWSPNPIITTVSIVVMVLDKSTFQ